jgi:hypothetical protein
MSKLSLLTLTVLSIQFAAKANIHDDDLRAFFDSRRNFITCLEQAKDKPGIERCCAQVLAATVKVRLNYITYKHGHCQSEIDDTLQTVTTILHAPEVKKHE